MDEVGKNTLEVMEKAKWYNEWVYSFIKPYLGKKTLEVGAGIGNFTKLLVKDTNVFAIDNNKDYKLKLSKIKNKKLISGFGDIEKGEYFFKNRKFDTIVSLNVLEHIKDDLAALKNMNKLLKKNGKMFLLVPAHQTLYSEFDKNLGHYRRYNLLGLEKKLKMSGFKKNNLYYFNWWAAIGWFVFLKLTASGKIPGNKVNIFNKIGKLFLWPEKFIKPLFGISVISISTK